MPMTPKEMINLLLKNGFIMLNKYGSHQKMFHPDKNITTIIPMHNKDLGKGLEHAILKQTGLK
ncbi:type II toxin-antitoxin system HicA family toxin [Tuanshanicoccus lijuaniae]|uniref:type II toxin-antitoxin system HicA family toxin n=1 Tax=Aerococcaceae bacterium zg-1292 TaxID=2774330 RepID=UPI001936F4A5|nr:type II toxin-antitoxin system HicA family toxin [Aerococcaceae bacterium zg-1292]QQA36540.1 type II toxin-antitoxin system HicA family toxin [Aerococcaceae bacterium zg-1292]